MCRSCAGAGFPAAMGMLNRRLFTHATKTNDVARTTARAGTMQGEK